MSMRRCIGSRGGGHSDNTCVGDLVWKSGGLLLQWHMDIFFSLYTSI